jgi:hypothetical protein
VFALRIVCPALLGSLVACGNAKREETAYVPPYVPPYRSSSAVPLNHTRHTTAWEVRFGNASYGIPAESEAGDVPGVPLPWKCRFGPIQVEQVDFQMLPSVPVDVVKRPIACSSDGWKTFVETLAGEGDAQYGTIHLRAAAQEYNVTISLVGRR